MPSTIRTSPQKLNLVAQIIRGKNAEQALAELSFSSRRVAGDVKKLLQAAIANAENNHQLDVDRLYVAEATVGKALVLKRFRRACPRPRRPHREAVQQYENRGARSRGDRLMGQKVNPIGLRLGINRTWDSAGSPARPTAACCTRTSRSGNTWTSG